MRESVIYQDILAEGESNLVIRLLNRQIGEISQNLQEQIRELPVKEIENLGEALLDFQGLADLVSWLERRKGVGPTAHTPPDVVERRVDERSVIPQKNPIVGWITLR